MTNIEDDAKAKAAKRQAEVDAVMADIARAKRAAGHRVMDDNYAG